MSNNDDEKYKSMVVLPQQKLKQSLSKGTLREKKNSQQMDHIGAKSHKTRSIEKSVPETEVTLSSPKKVEDILKKANVAIVNSKTSISNPVNRLSSLSGKVNGALIGDKNALKHAPEFPMTSEDAIKHLKLNDYEI